MSSKAVCRNDVCFYVDQCGCRDKRIAELEVTIALQTAHVDELEAENKALWNKCSTQSPPEGIEVLFAYRWEDDEGYIIEIDEFHSDEPLVDDCYWMPMPNPPKEKDDE